MSKFSISYEREDGSSTTVTRVGDLSSEILNEMFEEFIRNCNLQGDDFVNKNFLFDDAWVNEYTLEDALLEELEREGSAADEEDK